MRISSSLLFQTGLNSINAQQSDLMHLFQQIGSGQRMVTPSDDPLSAAQSINIRQSQALNARYSENREVAKRDLNIEENTLGSVTRLIQDIKTRLIEAGNGTMSDADRMTLANVLGHARTSLLGLANATDGNGQHLFSGSRGDVMPFDENGFYQGDAGQRNIQVDQTRRMAGSDVGTDIFSRSTPGINSYLTHAGTGTNFVSAPVNSGTGVISTATVHDATQTRPGYRFELTFAHDNTYTVAVYDALDPIPVTYDPLEHSFDWTQPQVFNPGETNLLTLPFGVQVKLAGNPAEHDVFSVIPAAGQDLNVFHTLDAMIAVLGQPFDADPVAQAHFQNALASSLQRVDVNDDNILTVRSSVGARLDELDALEANGSLRNLGYRAQLSRLEDLDYYTASTQFELRKSALEAAALAFRKIQGTSLFSMGANR